MRYVKQSTFPFSAAVLWAFHERPDAFSLLTPPWQPTEVVQAPVSLEVGTRVVVRAKLGPLWRTIVAEHIEYERGRKFADQMLEGPFKRWVHQHIIVATGPSQSMLTDDIEYELPLGVVGRVLGGPFARRELDRLFTYRHAVTRRECLAVQ